MSGSLGRGKVEGQSGFDFAAASGRVRSGLLGWRRTGAWIILVIAGFLEVVWALGMKASNGFTHPGWSVLTAVAALVSFWLPGLAMRDLPVGTAYAVWVGIGAAGAAIFGITRFGDAASPLRIAGVLLILLGAG